MSFARDRREYFALKLGVGKRLGCPPISAMHDLPERPGAARLKGGWRRSGHCTTLVVALAKLASSDF